MSQATLFLLKPGFTDAAQPGKTFFCPSCVYVEGLLGTYPQLLEQLQVVRVDFPRPRAAIIALAGAENQSAPLLVLDAISHSAHVTGEYEGRSLIDGKDAIAAYLAEQYGIDLSH
ncbi:Protein of unknown function [Lampropedia hyalina DSM 16112]|jgi:hypothetical protein|uniref:DUF3088 domain-containing protein n=1 Tax=Lampropedia hyalina DSM 16112 TaxID=1122156 RepID=A0A1M4XI03_9BURK|nr:DUF3088 domain-containing protein [Lampropedia hyalina]SHE93135.1 Protein of unknown function [Lampropedia hyalina DSM 16112]